MNIPAVEDRAKLVAALRSEIVGPSVPSEEAVEVKIGNGRVEIGEDVGPIFVRNPETKLLEEVLYYRSEGPARKYGSGVLHPDWSVQQIETSDQLEDAGFDADSSDDEPDSETDPKSKSEDVTSDGGDRGGVDVEIANRQRFRTSSIGISCHVKLPSKSELQVVLPTVARFEWQGKDAQPLPVNGRYNRIEVAQKQEKETWINRGAVRCNAFPKNTVITFSAEELRSERYITRDVVIAPESPQQFQVVVVCRPTENEQAIVTITLKNATRTNSPKQIEFMLFQAFFEVKLGGKAIFCPYPDPPQSSLNDPERDSLKLLYSRSKTWAVGHNCAAGWRKEDAGIQSVFADVFPVCETASMTPDIEAEGEPLRFSMKDLASLDDSGTTVVWQQLERLASAYDAWIADRRAEASGLPDDKVALQHLQVCSEASARIRRGIDELKANRNARLSFRLANQAMMLQQIATKVVKPRKLKLDTITDSVRPAGERLTPKALYESGDIPEYIGKWRAFQLAFLLMSLPDFVEGCDHADLGNIELIWFPTGGGKTEAYLGVAAYSMFLARFQHSDNPTQLPVDGTNILMRYTLRMLTTQQFQRAAALICAMEFLRLTFQEKTIEGGSFSLGLWIGRESTPNSNKDASARIKEYRSGKKTQSTNPLVLTECPWCRSQIGLTEGGKPRGWSDREWKLEALKGVVEDPEPAICCSDTACSLSKGIPVVVIDEQIYQRPPSLVIATADKLAVIPYRPDARAIFGRDIETGEVIRKPPSLVIQDETHLISGPLGTLFGLYESVIEVLCTDHSAEPPRKPKIICSTATIRGAGEQLKSIFGRERFTLFPAPGLDISDSFFGRYATKPDGHPMPGRMYLGIHATPPAFVSAQTAQIRLYSSLMVSVQNLIDEEARDPWWTILCFYNSLRELGGARTLFQGDIPARMKFLARRDKHQFRNDPRIEELSSRLKQDEIVAMMDRLNIEYPTKDGLLDVCLASNIIEVGVDIDRLSLMAVVGQPKNTAQYIQVTGRVGRRWNERPGLICMLYSASKLRDKSHFEQFHSYHSRLYEHVEPTTATPFSRASLDRALVGALLLYARCSRPKTKTAHFADYAEAIEDARQILLQRCQTVEGPNSAVQAQTIDAVVENLRKKWDIERDEWEQLDLAEDASVLMRWPGQYATSAQKAGTFEIPSSLRQVDRSGELTITELYADN